MSIILLDEKPTKKEINELEIKVIKKYRDNNIKIKNVQDGGILTINQAKSYKMAKRTRSDNPNKKIMRGNSSPSHILDENEILNIYKLIKECYSNNQIIKKLNLKVKNTTICAVRSGQNWGYLFKEHFDEVIPSIFVYDKNGNGGLEPRYKLLVIDLIVKGYTKKQITDKLPRIKNDFNSIKNKQIWKKAWKIYYKFYLPYRNEKKLNNKFRNK